MFIFDIDDTISPTKPPADWEVEHEAHHVIFGTIKIPKYVLEFMRERDDIALLSTWGQGAQKLSDAFGLNAKILLMDDDGYGVQAKFDVVDSLDGVTAWIDDHIKPVMKKKMEEKGVTVIRPTKGVITPRQIQDLRKLG